MTVQYLDTEIEDSDKDEPVSDAVIAEAEAIAHGLEIIRNADLKGLRELGSGTIGTVFHGKWRGSDVAIKRIKNSCFMGREPEQERMRADFWSEASFLPNLRHPNVVAFYGIVPDGPGGTLATVTEYMVDGSLKQVLHKKDCTIDRQKRWLIAMDAAFGMEYLHGKNIVHFDMKCENLLVSMRDPQRPICKVGDLGLSKIKHRNLDSGGKRGTLPWVAPEFLNRSSIMVSEKVDVFSFGIVMWELLTGEEPYANMHYEAIIEGVVNNTLRPSVPSWCDPAWRSLMEQCWSADPAARPSFTEIAGRLHATATSFHVKGHGHKSDWGQVSEIRVEENILRGKETEVGDEESMTVQYSDTKIIKNADLEELRELGSGGFGTVFHGKWRGSDVAIKRIKNSCLMGRESEQERRRADFWKEALMLAHLRHPNVVAFYGIVSDGPGGTLATVTEYMVDGSLKQVLRKKDRTIDCQKRWLIAMDAAVGMEHLHRNNIVHFDMKSDNLLVDMRDPQRPICKVGDLGLSKIKHRILVPGGKRGTLPWMAPELLNGSSSMVSEKVDVFSFGIVMWELLTGEKPYANMHHRAITGGVVDNTLRPPVPSWCDPAWRSLMEQCWSADPAARPSFTEIAGRLRATATSFHVKGHGHSAHIHHR